MPLTLSEAFELYRRDYIVYMNQSKKTEEMHFLAMKSLINFVGDIRTRDFEFQHVRSWKEHLEKTKSQNTVRGYIIKLKVVAAFAKKRGYVIIDADTIGIPKRKQTTVDFISEDDVSRLIDAAFEPRPGYSKVNRYRNRAIISLLYASGVRVSELCGVNISDIQPDSTFTVIGKGDKPRLCFFDSRTKYFINEYLNVRGNDNNQALFLSNLTDSRITAGTVQEVFQNVRIRGGFQQPITPHTMRHSYATNLLRNNTNLLYVSKFLGHASVQTTEMYTHVVDEDLRRIYQEKHST